MTWSCARTTRSPARTRRCASWITRTTVRESALSLSLSLSLSLLLFFSSCSPRLPLSWPKPPSRGAWGAGAFISVGWPNSGPDPFIVCRGYTMLSQRQPIPDTRGSVATQPGVVSSEPAVAVHQYGATRIRQPPPGVPEGPAAQQGPVPPCSREARSSSGDTANLSPSRVRSLLGGTPPKGPATHALTRERWRVQLSLRSASQHYRQRPSTPPPLCYQLLRVSRPDALHFPWPPVPH